MGMVGLRMAEEQVVSGKNFTFLRHSVLFLTAEKRKINQNNQNNEENTENPAIFTSVWPVTTQPSPYRGLDKPWDDLRSPKQLEVRSMGQTGLQVAEKFKVSGQKFCHSVPFWSFFDRRRTTVVP